MLQLQTVAKALENKLNAARLNALYPLNDFHDNTEYTFKVYADVGEYQRATKTLNTINRYINCILRINSDEKSGLTDETISAVWSCQFECLVPDAMEQHGFVDEDNSVEYVRFVDAVEELINSTLAASTQDYVKGDDGIVYYLGAAYSNTMAGSLELRHGAGNSIPLSVFIDYTVIATGLSSADIKLFIYDGEDYERIYPTRLDIIRTSVQEGNLASNSDGVSKVTTQGTVLTIKLSKPARFDDLDYEIREYLYKGDIHPVELKLEYPQSRITQTDAISVGSRTYQMVFSDASVAAETNLAASCTATLVEVLEI